MLIGSSKGPFQRQRGGINDRVRLFHRRPRRVNQFSHCRDSTTVGCGALCQDQHPSTTDGNVSSIPEQALLPNKLQKSPESENNIFGRVLNPRNLSWGAGGSSGGEGALVALRGSLIGVGTDIAGSIRIPSLSCGIFGFKPTASRVPYGGQRSGNRRGNPGIQPSAGPLATSFRDLKFFMETVIGARPWNYDPTALAVPWRDIGRTLSPLTLGYVGEDPQYPLHPPVVRALRSAMDKLTGVGHKVKVLENVPSISKAALLAFKLFELDNNNTALRPLEDSGEPEIPSLKTSNMTFPGHQFTLEELFDLNAERAQFVADWEKVWLENDLDAIIMPGHRKTAGPHETYGHPPYTLVWNLVDVRDQSSQIAVNISRANSVSSVLRVSFRTNQQMLPSIPSTRPCQIVRDVLFRSENQQGC
jgi:Asp-tRNA(Asn)/Glu-tRNA(Gln) amidotransferase A subunit family amidase